MAHYELIDRFDIDDGELDGLSITMAFTLGVEWEMLSSNGRSIP